ncbi:MAG: acetate--CoA ligase [Kiloniellales bacterium]
MSDSLVRKSRLATGLAPNLDDYERARATFSWEAARAELDGLPDGGLNIAYEAVDRQVLHGRGEKTALRWLGRNGIREEISYAALNARTNRFVNLLRRLGLRRGERVFCLAGRVPDVYVAALGTMKNGSVFSPLFSAFGPEPIRTRMELGDARILVTTAALYRRKIAAWRGALPNLKHVLLIDGDGDGDGGEDGLIDLSDALAAENTEAEIAATAPDDIALLHFTSGTTGPPKGAIHCHAAVICHHMSGRFALDIHPEDIFWCTADPGWVTGTSYGIIAPLTIGATLVVDEAEFDVERWYRILQDEKITVWYTSPTAIRMLMKAGSAFARSYDTSALRFMASVGEPLNPEAVVWGQKTFGMPFHDNWWQTETGGIMIANTAGCDVKPGSMGRALPGVDAAILRREKGAIVEESDPKTIGELALRRGWPSMFRGYLHNEERYRKCFAGDWYLTGDLAMRDSDGYYWFVGRADDMIKSSGHLIGPFEVESALMEHPAVAEVGVIGKPDPVAGEIVKAFVALKPGFGADETLRRDLQGHARKRLGAVVAPKEIDFRTNLPKTRSGKIMRRLLKARELGLPEGDVSSLESDER